MRRARPDHLRAPVMAPRRRLRRLGAGLAVLAVALAACGGSTGRKPAVGKDPTVWLCHPGSAGDPCATSLRATVVPSGGAPSIVDPAPDTASRFDCFYIYPTVSQESTDNADLQVQQSEIETAKVQAAPFSTTCRVWAPIYRQVTRGGLVRLYLAGPRSQATRSGYAVAYSSLQAAFEDYLARYNHGRPIVILAHSQGAIIAIELLQKVFDGNPALRRRLVMAIVLGGNVTVRSGAATGGSFSHIPVCGPTVAKGCVLAYSSFPSQPPADAFFGYPRAVPGGQPVASGPDMHVACVNPASGTGGSETLLSWFPVGPTTVPAGLHVTTPWVIYPDLYTASCRQGGGASWLQVTPIPDRVAGRPVITETRDLGPRWGFHVADFNLATGNLVADVAAAERAWRG